MRIIVTINDETFKLPKDSLKEFLKRSLDMLGYDDVSIEVK